MRARASLERVAEFAIVVLDAHQGQGIGAKLRPGAVFRLAHWRHHPLVHIGQEGVVDRDRDVPERRAEIVLVDAVVVGELEHCAALLGVVGDVDGDGIELEAGRIDQDVGEAFDVGSFEHNRRRVRPVTCDSLAYSVGL